MTHCTLQHCSQVPAHTLNIPGCWDCMRAVPCAAPPCCDTTARPQHTPAPHTRVISSSEGCNQTLLCVCLFPKSRKVSRGSQGRKRGLMQSTRVCKWNTQLYNGKAQFEMFVKQASSGLKCQHFSPFYVVGE